MGVKPQKDQFGYPDESNDIDHGRNKGPQPKTSTPKAGSFSDKTPPAPFNAPKFKGPDAVNPMGAKKGNPSGFPGL